MSRYCKYCGGLIDEKTGICTKCHKQINVINNTDTLSVKQITENLSKKELKKLEKEKARQAEFIRKYEDKASRPLSKKIGSLLLKNLLLFLLLSVIAAGVLGTLQYFKVIDVRMIGDIMDRLGLARNIDEETAEVSEEETQNVSVSDNTETVNEDESYYVEYIDIEEYYKDKASIVSSVPANESGDVKSETDVYDVFYERGFKQYPYTSNYSMDGEISDEEEISGYSSDKHPIYQTYYMTENGDVWLVNEINGNLMASLVGDSSIVLSENDHITAYDSVTNKFYDLIPNESFVRLITVAELNSETLENFDISSIGR